MNDDNETITLLYTQFANGQINGHQFATALAIERKRELDTSRGEISRLNNWIADLQSGMYVNCVYCGHRYGPEKETPVAMADILKAHIEICPKHPMSQLKKENIALQSKLDIAVKAIYEAISYGNRLDIYKVLNAALQQIQEIKE